jgi:hypothetical protein
MKEFNEDNALCYDPFQGDFGCPGDVIFSDKFVIARKEGPCFECKTTITKGERVRRQSGVFDGEMLSFRFCRACCHAFSLAFEEDYEAHKEAMEERQRVREQNEAESEEGNKQ